MSSAETWARRQLISHRRLLVRQRTVAKSSIRAVLNRRLIEHPYGLTLFSETNQRASRPEGNLRERGQKYQDLRKYRDVDAVEHPLEPAPLERFRAPVATREADQKECKDC